MTFLRLLIRNLFYHWRGNFAVFLGIALGAAVLTGALLVGDSLRGSLKALTLDQLGWVEEAMVPGRFFRAQLADEISAERRAAVLLLQGSATRKGADDEPPRVGKVTVLGVDASFWPSGEIPEGTAFWASDDFEVVLNQTLADALRAKVGDTVRLQLQKPDTVPRESLMGERKAEEITETLNVKVRAVLADEGMARFSLKPTPQPQRNAFVPIRLLQKRLALAGRANALFVAQAKATLAADLQQHLKMDDWGLRYRSPTDRAEAFIRYLDPKDIDQGNLRKIRWNEHVPEALAAIAKKNGNILPKKAVIEFYESHRDYYMLESRRMFLDPLVVRAIETLSPLKPADPEDDKFLPRWRWRPILIYLADSLRVGKKIEVPYSIIASQDDAIVPKLADDQIMLTSWPGSPLTQIQPGTEIRVEYYSPDEKNHLELKGVNFKVQAVVPLEGVLDDPDLVPEFPGITDKLDMADWTNPPFPYFPKRVKLADENYWKRYRTTPKAYVSLKTAQKLWASRFGDVTSIQFRLGRDDPETLPKALLAALRPEQGGFVFQKVREQALQASTGANDFGVLFLAFSFFLIVSALLLVGLLVRLNLDRRAGEMGLLLATGWDHGRVRRLLLGEGTLLTLVGAAVGLGGAMLYAHLMLRLLAANWPGGANLNFLRLHAEPISFVFGYAGSFAVSVLTLWWATRVLSKLSPRSLLSGETMQTMGLADAKPGWSRWLVPIGAFGAGALAMAARRSPSQEAQAISFFGSGALLLTACLAGVWNGLKRTNRASSPQPSLTLLGMRNAGRHAVRSVLTVGLLASSSFLVVAVESFHKDTDQSFHLKTGGSGGFALYAEGNAPVFEDLNQPEVRAGLEPPLDEPEMRLVKFFPCRVQAGDDASCLNLYKTLKPRVMGLSKEFIQRGGFHFGAVIDGASAAEIANPWLLLNRPKDDAIPAIIDANTAQWVLKVGIGGTVDVNNDQGESVKLRIVALLEESFFQSEVLIAEANFKKLYPRQQGWSFLLIDAGAVDAQTLNTIKSQIGKSLDKTGMDVQTTASRLDGYLAVENTYLQTFQALGGLGLILGAAGLAIVLLRGVWERRAELALLSALGFRPGQLARLVLVENAFLLVLGLATGTVSALLAVAPHLAGSGAQVLWLRIAGLLALVLAVGLMAAALAVWSTVRTPVLTALRRE